MGLGTLVGGWADHHKSLASTHVLVVDDEQVVGDLLTELLEDEGFKVHVAGSAEVAWELIQAGEYQLVITDKNLPGESGIDLIKRIAGASIDVPVVLITGYPSISSVSQALASGAADYIAKPFDDVMVVLRRLTLVADRNRSRRLFREILNDLARVVKGADDGRQRLAEIQEAHRGFHDALAGRPDVLLCDKDPTRATAGIMRASGLASSTAPTRQHAVGILAHPEGPLTAMVNLDVEDSVAYIRELRAIDPFAEFLVTTQGENLERSLDALSAGAADFVFIGTEGIGAMAARMRRLVERSSRRRRHAHLLGLLYKQAHAASPDLAATLLALVPEQDRPHIEKSPTS